MTMLTTPYYQIRYPDKNEPPTISTHLANIAKDIDTAMHNYVVANDAAAAAWKAAETKARTDWQTASSALWASWKAPMDARMLAIENALKVQGWGTPTTIAGTLATAASGWTINSGSRAVKVGNVCAFTIKFQKAADPSIVAGSNGNMAFNVLVATLTAAMPTPTTYTPFSTMEDGFQVMGFINPTKQVSISALAPNVNLPKLYPMTLGGIYLFNPTIP